MAKKRVIDELRKLFPDQTWRYERQGHYWACESGEVSGVSRLTPRYDGDDDTFSSELWFYPTEGKATCIAWRGAFGGGGGWVFSLKVRRRAIPTAKDATTVAERIRERADRVQRQMDNQTKMRPGFGDIFIGEKA